jgi:hypothetical protein
MFRAGDWFRGNLPGARISAEQIHYRDRCRRTAASWHRKSLAALFSEDLVGRSVLRKSRHSQPKVQQPVGPACGSGISCQHRSCRCPRRLSFVEMTSQRTTAHESFVRFTSVGCGDGSVHDRRGCQWALSTRERLKIGSGPRTVTLLWTSHPQWLVETSDASPQLHFCSRHSSHRALSGGFSGSRPAGNRYLHLLRISDRGAGDDGCYRPVNDSDWPDEPPEARPGRARLGSPQVSRILEKSRSIDVFD